MRLSAIMQTDLVTTAPDVLVDSAERRLVAGDPLLHVRGHGA